MNYHKLYNSIIQNRKQNPIEGYTETHHIIPRSLGGTNDKENLVDLTAREHFICHLLLTKMYKEGSIEWIKMCKAFMNMFRCGNHERYSPSKWYEYCRLQVSKANSINQSGTGNSQYGKCWIINPITEEKKSIKKELLQEYLNNGWKKGRSLLTENKQPYDQTGKYIRLSKEQKEKNKLQRKQLLEKKRQSQGKTYQVTNKLTQEKRFVTEQELKQLDVNWISLYYKVDKEKVKDLFKQGYKIQQIADYFNMSYHNFYSWYKPFRKEIQSELKDIFSKTRICPICGKEYPKYPQKNYCSRECWLKANSTRLWVRKNEELKHILEKDLVKYIEDGWMKVKPIPGKPSSEWY
jgi:hypothetical protein